MGLKALSLKRFLNKHTYRNWTRGNQRPCFRTRMRNHAGYRLLQDNKAVWNFATGKIVSHGQTVKLLHKKSNAMWCRRVVLASLYQLDRRSINRRILSVIVLTPRRKIRLLLGLVLSRRSFVTVAYRLCQTSRRICLSGPSTSLTNPHTLARALP